MLTLDYLFLFNLPMKIREYNSTLSCILKSLRFLSSMINKKIIFGLFILCFLGGCTSPTAMLGPVYTMASTGNVYQAGLTYGSNEYITKSTGKTPIENLKRIGSQKKEPEKNVRKKTLESEAFYILVKNKIEKTKDIFNN